MVYPIILLVIAAAVILTMLLWVVPQFEGLFSDAGAQLPFMTRMVMGISHAVRKYGLVGFGVGAALVIVMTRWVRGPSMRGAFDRWMLNLPQIGPLTTASELGRFARVLGSLVEGGVPLPEALAIARRSLANTHLSAAMGRVAGGVKQGAGLTASLSAEGVFPRGALSFIRTGEETAQLGLMLGRLADVHDREVRSACRSLDRRFDSVDHRHHGRHRGDRDRVDHDRHTWIQRPGPVPMTEIRRSDPSRAEAGFTLLELLVVLAILGLLAAIVAPQVLRYLGTSRTQTAKVQIENISASLDHFQLDVGRYPTPEEGLDSLVKPPPSAPNWNGPYLKKSSALVDPWGQKYFYTVPGKHAEVDVYTLGSDHAEGGTGEAKDVGNW